MLMQVVSIHLLQQEPFGESSGTFNAFEVHALTACQLVPQQAVPVNDSS